MQKIFVIEDDENIRNLVKIALEGYGYQVAAFETAEEALEIVGREKPDLAVFDLMLPGMDGLSAIRIIRGREDELKSMPIIVLTAKDKEFWSWRREFVRCLEGRPSSSLCSPRERCVWEVYVWIRRPGKWP